MGGLSRNLQWIAAVVACSIAGFLVAQTTRPTTAPAAVHVHRPAQTQPAVIRPPFAPGDPQQILKGLSSPNWRVRRAAQALLVRGGDDAKPFIRMLIDKAPDDEARNNALAAIAQIDQNRKLGASYITLRAKNATPAEVFAEISRQCHAPLATMPENLWSDSSFPKITLDADHEPFWELIPKICRKLGVDFRPYQDMNGQGGGMRIMRTGGLAEPELAQVEGPFLIVANQITYSRTRMMNGPAQQTRFGLNFSIFAEPKLTVLRAGGMVRVDQATDDQGNSLLPESTAPRVWGGYAGFGGWNFYAPLRYPRNIGTRIVAFKGAAQFVVETDSQKIEIAGLPHLAQTSRDVNGIQVDFQSMTRHGDVWRLQLHIPDPNYASPQWQQLVEGVESRLQVLDAKSDPMQHRGMSSRSSNGAIDLLLDFVPSSNLPPNEIARAPQPSRIVWDIPTQTHEIDVPINFKNLPLFEDK